MIAMKPLGRLAEAEDMGAAAAFLASDDAKYIVGISLDVDGGMMMRY
jgi:NAD(P)-dependent dehydrogenase (short-subunit alcohol dehydrogenase family)